jgi:hypothetical protein
MPCQTPREAHPGGRSTEDSRLNGSTTMAPWPPTLGQAAARPPEIPAIHFSSPVRALGVLAPILLACIAATPAAGESPVVTTKVEGRFGAVLDNVRMAIVGRGLNVAHTLPASGMLSRTGPAFGIREPGAALRVGGDHRVLQRPCLPQARRGESEEHLALPVHHRGVRAPVRPGPRVPDLPPPLRDRRGLARGYRGDGSADRGRHRRGDVLVAVGGEGRQQLRGRGAGQPQPSML